MPILYVLPSQLSKIKHCNVCLNSVSSLPFFRASCCTSKNQQKNKQTVEIILYTVIDCSQKTIKLISELRMAAFLGKRQSLHHGFHFGRDIEDTVSFLL